MNAMVEIAEHAIRRFAGDVDRFTAEKVLHLWEHYEDITSATRTAVLAQFPLPVERLPVAGKDFLPGTGCCGDCDDELDFAEWSSEVAS